MFDFVAISTGRNSALGGKHDLQKGLPVSLKKNHSMPRNTTPFLADQGKEV
jgi:hypothetical protein